jgi:hypothetical protein
MKPILYVICYDLNDNRDESNIADAILKLALGHCRELYSTWIIIANCSAGTIRDSLWPHFEPGERLFVSCICKDAAWAGFPKPANEWLEQMTGTVSGLVQ